MIDPWVGLAEAGWAQLPVMMHAGWAAWWHIYLGRLRRRLEELHMPAAGSHVVQVFHDQVRGFVRHRSGWPYNTDAGKMLPGGS
jgi:hypothetical protein